jgi:hypothetical protein
MPTAATATINFDIHSKEGTARFFSGMPCGVQEGFAFVNERHMTPSPHRCPLAQPRLGERLQQSPAEVCRVCTSLALPPSLTNLMGRYEAAWRRTVERRQRRAERDGAAEALARAYSAAVLPPWAVTLDGRAGQGLPSRPASAACVRPREIEEAGGQEVASFEEELASRRAATTESRRLTLDRHHVPAAQLPRNMRNSAGRKPWWPSENILDALRERSRSAGISTRDAGAQHDKRLPTTQALRPATRSKSRARICLPKGTTDELIPCRSRGFSKFGCTGPRRDTQTPEILARELEVLVRLEARVKQSDSLATSSAPARPTSAQYWARTAEGH